MKAKTIDEYCGKPPGTFKAFLKEKTNRLRKMEKKQQFASIERDVAIRDIEALADLADEERRLREALIAALNRYIEFHNLPRE